MQEMVKSGTVDQGVAINEEKPLAFLDTNVILNYIQGEPSAVRLFAAAADGQLGLAVNPVVLQELLLSVDTAKRPDFGQLSKQLRVLPLNLEKAEALVPHVRAMQDELAHVNDVLILSSADACDFLVTSDRLLKRLVMAEKPEVITSEELVIRLLGA